MNIYVILLVLAVILVLGFGLLWLMGARRTGISEGERAKIQGMWSNVELLMSDDNEASWTKAVFEADKALDFTMTARRIYGANLGEKLKNGKNMFSNVQSAWDAHKLRNRLAHEMDMRLARHEAEQAVRLFKDSLRQLGGL